MDPRFDDFEKRIKALEDALFKKKAAASTEHPAKRNEPEKPVATRKGK